MLQQVGERITWETPVPVAPDTQELSVFALFERMLMAHPIIFNGKIEYINGIARESGSIPCHNWIVQLTYDHYYWDSRKGYFSLVTATKL